MNSRKHSVYIIFLINTKLFSNQLYFVCHLYMLLKSTQLKQTDRLTELIFFIFPFQSTYVKYQNWICCNFCNAVFRTLRAVGWGSLLEKVVKIAEIMKNRWGNKVFPCLIIFATCLPHSDLYRVIGEQIQIRRIHFTHASRRTV